MTDMVWSTVAKYTWQESETPDDRSGVPDQVSTGDHPYWSWVGSATDLKTLGFCCFCSSSFLRPWVDHSRDVLSPLPPVTPVWEPFPFCAELFLAAVDVHSTDCEEAVTLAGCFLRAGAERLCWQQGKKKRIFRGIRRVTDSGSVASGFIRDFLHG